MSSKYLDLLYAIKNQNFEAIENLCEHNLTQELASKIYELQRFNNIQFRIANTEETKIDARIINHFYVIGMQIERNLNPSLNDLKMVTNQSGDNLIYLNKNDEIDEQNQQSFYQTKQSLDNLLALKEYYKIGGKGPNDSSQRNFENVTGSDNEIIERGKYDKLPYIQNEQEKAFKEVMT